MNSQNDRTIVIIGMGLIGGSLGLALCRFAKGRPRRWRVIGVGKGEKSLRMAKRRGACHEISMDWRAAVSQADDVVICTPPAEIVPVLEKVWPWVKSGVVISDVGSVKEPVLEGWRKLEGRRNRVSRPSFSFVGAHPMAGSESSGIQHAKAGLFRGAVCAVTPGAGVSRAAVRRVEDMWRACGARPVLVNARAHDRIVALTSHVPHLLASALTLSLMRECKAELLTERFVARSFLDMTRIAASSPAMWSGIFKLNGSPIRSALKVLETHVRRLCAGRGAGPLLEASAAFRRRWSR